MINPNNITDKSMLPIQTVALDYSVSAVDMWNKVANSISDTPNQWFLVSIPFWTIDAIDILVSRSLDATNPSCLQLIRYSTAIWFVRYEPEPIKEVENQVRKQVAEDIRANKQAAIEAGARAYDPEAWTAYDRESPSTEGRELMVEYSKSKAESILAAAEPHLRKKWAKEIIDELDTARAIGKIYTYGGVQDLIREGKERNMDDNQELNESNHEKECKLIGVIPKLISREAVEFDSSTDSANKIFEWLSELKFAKVSLMYSGDEVDSIKIITTMKEFFIEKGNWVIKMDNGIDVLTVDELHSKYRIIPHSYFCVESKTKS